MNIFPLAVWSFVGRDTDRAHPGIFRGGPVVTKSQSTVGRAWMQLHRVELITTVQNSST